MPLGWLVGIKRLPSPEGPAVQRLGMRHSRFLDRIWVIRLPPLVQKHLFYNLQPCMFLNSFFEFDITLGTTVAPDLNAFYVEQDLPFSTVHHQRAIFIGLVNIFIVDITASCQIWAEPQPAIVRRHTAKPKPSLIDQFILILTA